MKFYISATGIKRLAVSSVAAGGGRGVWRGMKWKNSLPAAGKRRLSHRTIRLFAGLLLPFLFFRTAFLVLESAALCSSPIGCLTWRFFGGSDAALVVPIKLDNNVGVGVGLVDKRFLGLSAISFTIFFYRHLAGVVYCHRFFTNRLLFILILILMQFIAMFSNNN